MTREQDELMTSVDVTIRPSHVRTATERLARRMRVEEICAYIDKLKQLHPALATTHYDRRSRRTVLIKVAGRIAFWGRIFWLRDLANEVSETSGTTLP